MSIYFAACARRRQGLFHKESDEDLDHLDLDVISGLCTLCGRKVNTFKFQYPCGHKYHCDCLWRWEKNHSNRTNLCPACFKFNKN